MTNSDIRPLRGFTIDGETSLDLDDALWIEPAPHGWTLTVTISLVAGQILRGDARDQRAQQLVETLYFAESQRNMLPRYLACDRLTLQQGEPRDVLVIRIELDRTYRPLETRLSTGTLTSEARLTYSQAAEILAGERAEHPELYGPLRDLEKMAAVLLRSRAAVGDMVLLHLSDGLVVDEEGRIVRVRVEERNMAFVIVQESMILANRMTAEALARSGYPALYRNHRARPAAPDRDDWNEEVAIAFSRPSEQGLARLNHRFSLIMERAEYSPQLQGHYGLNVPAYTHATSPIRRYVDLVNQRVLVALISGAPAPYTGEELAEIADRVNAYHAEQRALEEERYRRRAVRGAEQMVADAQSPEDLAREPSSTFYMILRGIADRADPPEVVVQSIQLRTRRSDITVKELHCLLFATTRDSAVWRSLRAETIQWLQAHAPAAPSILSVGTDSRRWTAPEFTFGTLGTFHTCIAAVQEDDRTVTTIEYSAGSRKEAMQYAAVALCCQLCGESPPPDWNRQAALATAAAQPKQKKEGAPARRVAAARCSGWAFQQVTKAVNRYDYVGAVIALAAFRGLPAPAVTLDEVPGEQAFRATISFRGGRGVPPAQFEATWTNKARARKEAAKLLYEHWMKGESAR